MIDFKYVDMNEIWVAWWSAGVTSAVATKIALDAVGFCKDLNLFFENIIFALEL